MVFAVSLILIVAFMCILAFLGYIFFETSFDLIIFEKLRDYIDRSDAEYARMQQEKNEMIDKIDTLKDKKHEDI